MYNVASKIKAIPKFDFRSDTVTKPSLAMRQAISASLVGDDVLDQDPTVLALGDKLRELSHMAASLLCASGTMANQIAIRCALDFAPPYSVLLHKDSHMLCYEAGGIPFHTGAHVIQAGANNDFLTEVEVKQLLVTSEDVHYAPTRVVILENTMNGQVMPFDEMRKISKLCKSLGIHLHLDGARLWNASVAAKTPIHEYCSLVDSVSLCFSKGLGAPIGSSIIGSEAFIKKATHVRKLYGGGWRQAGIVASAALFAIQNNFPLLYKDHENAAWLGKEISHLGLKITKHVDTNMVWVDFTGTGISHDMLQRCAEMYDCAIFGGRECGVARFVLHHETDRMGCEMLVKAIKDTLAYAKSSI